MSNLEGFKNKIKRGLRSGLKAGAASLAILTANTRAQAIEISQAPETVPFADPTVNEAAPYVVRNGQNIKVFFQSQRQYDSQNDANKGASDIIVAETTNDQNWTLDFVKGDANSSSSEGNVVVDTTNNKLYFQRLGDIYNCDFDYSTNTTSNCNALAGEITETYGEGPLYVRDGYLFYTSDRTGDFDLYASQIGVGNRLYLTGSINTVINNEGSLYVGQSAGIACTNGNYNQNNNAGGVDCYLFDRNGLNFTNPQHIEFPTTPLVDPTKNQSSLKIDSEGDMWLWDNSSGKAQILRARKITSTCSNGIIEGTEECDGSNLNGKTCADFGFNSGNLNCVNCTLDKSGCTNIQDGGVDADAETPDADAGVNAETGSDAKDEPDADTPDADAATPDANETGLDSPNSDADAAAEWITCGTVKMRLEKTSSGSCHTPVCVKGTFDVDQTNADCLYALTNESSSGFSIMHTKGSGTTVMDIDGTHAYPDKEISSIQIDDSNSGPKVTVVYDVEEATFGDLSFGPTGTDYTNERHGADEPGNPYQEAFVRLHVDKGAVAPKLNDVSIQMLDEKGSTYTEVKAGMPDVDFSLKDGRFIGAPIVTPDGGGIIVTPPESGDGGGCSVCSATPGNVSSNTNNMIYALLGAYIGVMAARRRKQE